MRVGCWHDMTFLKLDYYGIGEMRVTWEYGFPFMCYGLALFREVWTQNITLMKCVYHNLSCIGYAVAVNMYTLHSKPSPACH